MLIKPSKLVGTLDELQAALNDPAILDITINSIISIDKDTVIDFHGKKVNIVLNFSRDAVFTLGAEGIALTFKSSKGYGGIIPLRLNQDVALVENNYLNNTATFDAGFNVDYSAFENFNVIRSPKAMTLNFTGANITSTKKISATSINISGGSITCNGDDAAISSGGTFNMSGGTISANSGIYSTGVVNISGGEIISKGTKYPAVFAEGENAFVSISGGKLTSTGNVCVHLMDGAKGNVSGGTFEGYYAISIADSNSGLTDKVKNATFNTDFDYGLLNGACVSIKGVTYKHTGEGWSNIKVNFTYSVEDDRFVDETQIASVEIRNGSVEVTDKSGTLTLKKGDEYEYVKSFDKIIKYWQGHLFTKYNLKYRSEILASLYFGLQTDKIIMLVGNPGTGKTTLVKYLAKSFGFEDAAIIPVQPNWTDKGDLLGYYNPLEKNYMATEFLEALIKFSRLAENQPDKIFIICLDEMNLAHIEYYFAEFLSALQTDRKISLYSETIRENILRELKIGGFDLDSDVEFDANAVLEMNVTERQYYLDLWRMYDMIKKFPAVLTIPPNVKFFGTLNQDETTLDVSPKVIDRAYIIRLEMSDEKLNFDGDFKNTLEYKPLESYRQGYSTLSSDLAKNLKDSMNAVAPISYRLIAQIFNNENFKTWQGVMGGKSLADFIISSCFLPKVRLDEDAYKIKIDALKKLCAGHILSEKILSDINTGIEADFWRR